MLNLHMVLRAAVSEACMQQHLRSRVKAEVKVGDKQQPSWHLCVTWGSCISQSGVSVGCWGAAVTLEVNTVLRQELCRTWVMA